MTDRRTGWRLGPRQRKVVLVLHIVAGIGWMGVDFALLSLLFTGMTTADGALAAASYRAVAVIVPAVLPTLSLAMLASGLVLGWGTKWGVLRYWWVGAKLALAVVMVLLVWFSLVPELQALDVPDATRSADAVRDQLGDAATQLLFPPIVSFLMLGIATVLSVFKPWRQTPWRQTPWAASRRGDAGRVERVDSAAPRSTRG